MRSTPRSAKGGSSAPAVTEKGHSATALHLRMHPRVFAALGADLVTSDVVAVIELVKNSYDAYAHQVWVRLGTEGDQPYLEIEDDGQGMTRDVIADVWCLVATPYKVINPNIGRNGATRRVSGAKGLGRLSVGRLGERLTLLTKAAGHPCWQVEVDWTDLAAKENFNDSTVELRRRLPKTLRRNSGTLLRVHALRSRWEDEQCEELKDNLERLISPFKGTEDFRIYFTTTTDEGEENEIRISTPKFLTRPKYRIRGEADDQGNLTAQYRYRAISTHAQREREVTSSWQQIKGSRYLYGTTPNSAPRSASCGAFSFDIRAWDIAAEDTREIGDQYGLQRRRIRAAIRAHKGISVYRDGVLVLPKSEDGRDWLGLDLRRVSHVGPRVSTSQLVGYVSITADGNPGIEDTSDRERFVASRPVREFQGIIKAIIEILENERDQDRAKDAKETPMEDLLGEVSAQDAIEDVRALAQAGHSAGRAIPVVRNLHQSLTKTRKDIERRFTYYSRLATVGTVAHMLVHEIRNRTTAISQFLRLFRTESKKELRRSLAPSFKIASESVSALERLADVFRPLASRRFKQGSRTSLLEERIEACLRLQQQELQGSNIDHSPVPDSRTRVAIHPGELDAVLLNLITNSIYWLQELKSGTRMLDFSITQPDDATRVLIRASDTGPGIHSEDLERVFWPGMTRKPNGIGMGLTVASELVAAYGGRMAAQDVDTGACFVFDLPLAREQEIP